MIKPMVMIMMMIIIWCDDADDIPLPGGNVKQPLANLHRLLHVEVVVAAPQPGEDGGGVERTVAHDVELNLFLVFVYLSRMMMWNLICF